MAKYRSYKLLCPIARALDRIGDRWTLLIIRDLHAGPARFTDLQRGLTGIAANLLTERLAKLVSDGLAEKTDGGHGTSVYALTDCGRKTSDIIFDLAVFGSQFEPEEEITKPGNLRTVATTLGAASRRVAPADARFEALVVVDGEKMCLRVNGNQSEMIYEECKATDLIFTTSYSALLAVTEGKMALSTFTENHVTLKILSPGKEVEFMSLMTEIVSLLRQEI
ncbi:MAG: helix-turn-helix domain-containing protein [Pseudomonadota bacterium]